MQNYKQISSLSLSDAGPLDKVRFSDSRQAGGVRYEGMGGGSRPGKGKGKGMWGQAVGSAMIREANTVRERDREHKRDKDL